MSLPKRFHDRAEVATVRAEAERLDADTESNAERRLAGRVLARRDLGKLMFLDLVDRSGRIQLLVHPDELGGVDLSTIVRGHLDIYGSLANPRGISRRGLQLMARGAIDPCPLITHHFGLDEFGAGWATFVERRDGAIRVMLHP